MSKNSSLAEPVFITARETIIKPPQITEGTLLAERYSVIRKLHEGGVGSVYLARDNTASLDVALKIINCNCAAAAGRLLHEKRIYDALDDTSGVVKCYGMHHGRVGHIPVMFLVKEYACYGNLDDWLAKYSDDHQYRLSKGLEVFKSCARSVVSLHQQGIVCGDLSSANFVKVGNVFKICDLDLASCKDKNILCDAAPGKWGNLAVMAPEVFDASFFYELDYRCDIYSMAVIFYQMLSASTCPPFSAGSYDRMRQLHCGNRPPRLDCVEEYLGELIYKGLRKDPAERFDDLEQFIDDIDNKKPEVIDHNKGRQSFLAGKAKYEKGEYWDAEIELEKVSPEHEDFAFASKLLEDIKSRYEQVTEMASEMSSKLKSRENLSELRGLCSQCDKIYPAHPCLRPVEAALKVNAKRTDQLFELFKASFQCGDLKGVEDILTQMQCVDCESEKTYLARRIVNVTEASLDDIQDRLDIAEICHDHEYSLKVQSEYEMMFESVFSKDGLKKIDSQIKLLEEGKGD